MPEPSGAQSSLTKTNRICKLSCVVMKIVFVIFCLWWGASTILMCLALINPNVFVAVSDINFFGIALYLADGVVIAVMLVVFIMIFSDTSKGQSPFVMKQVKRLRIIALMLVLYAVFDSAISFNASFLHFSWSMANFISVGNNPFTTINFAPLIAAAVLFAFSFVFKYGVLLQELSDETL